MKLLIILLLIATTNSIKIGCYFTFGINFVNLGKLYGCDVYSMDFSDNSTHVINFIGNHQYGNSSIDVKGIQFCNYQNYNLTAVPKGLLTIFPNIIGFTFAKCNINYLHGNELDEYPNLQFWTFAHTNLERIPGEFFASTK